MKILIIRLTAIGDVLRVLPALNCIRENIPDAEIHWLVEDKASSALHGHPQIDRLIIWERKKLSGFLKSRSLKDAAVYVLSFFKQLVDESYDTVFDFHGILKSGIFSGSTLAPRRFGFSRKDSREGNFLFNTEFCVLPDKRINRVERNMKLIEKAGLKNFGLKAVFPVSEKDISFARNFYLKNNLSDFRVFSVYPGSSSVASYKRWNPAKYVELCNKLNSKFRSKSLILWGPGEEQLAVKIASDIKDSVLSPMTSLGELAALISLSSLFIGGDTGPMHIAWLLGVPTAAIFCPTDPLINCPPEGSRSIFFHPDIHCAPCRIKNCLKGLCIEAVTTDIVFDGIVRLLSSET